MPHRLSDNYRADLAQGPHGGVVALREIAFVGSAAHLRRHVLGLEQILNAD